MTDHPGEGQAGPSAADKLVEDYCDWLSIVLTGVEKRELSKRIAEALRASEAALAEAQGHVRNHHLEACVTCIANESARNAAEAELAERTKERDEALALLSQTKMDANIAILKAEQGREAARAEATKAVFREIDTRVGVVDENPEWEPVFAGGFRLGRAMVMREIAALRAPRQPEPEPDVQDPIGSPAALAFCTLCAGGNRSLPVLRHEVLAYVHHTTGGEEILCRASAIKVAESSPPPPSEEPRPMRYCRNGTRGCEVCGRHDQCIYVSPVPSPAPTREEPGE